MSDTLLCIMSWKGAIEQVWWSWPHYRTSGLPIMGVCAENANHDWPEDIEYVWNVGLDTGYSTPDLVERWVRIFERFVSDPDLVKYNSLMVVEYDSIFLKPPPPVPDGVFTHLSGGNVPGPIFKASRFYHCPWGASRYAAGIIAQEGRKLINERSFENGSPDFFLGLILDRHPELPLYETGTFSVNGGNWPERMNEMVEAVKNGAFFCHGLRTKEELSRALEAYKSTL